MLPLTLNAIYRHLLQAALSGISAGSKAMIEVVTALALFFSMSIFLAHAFDGYRTR